MPDATSKADDIHVHPVGDLRDHELTRTCWCQPDVRQDPDGDGTLVIHNSLDGRELIEKHGLQ